MHHSATVYTCPIMMCDGLYYDATSAAAGLSIVTYLFLPVHAHLELSRGRPGTRASSNAVYSYY